MVEFYLGWFSVLGMDPEPYAHPASTLSLSYMPSPPCLNCRNWYQVSILIRFTSLLGWETIGGVISTLYGQTQFLIVEEQGHVWTKPKLKKPKGLQEGFLEKPWESWQREESRWTAGWVHECLLCRRVCMKALMNQRPLSGHPDVIL